MQILVTDATGTVGRLVARQLIAAGHSVMGIAERHHPCLERNVEFVCAPLSDPVLQDLADAADAVIHLAPLDPTAPGSADIDGVAQVTDAAARAGARLLYVSQAAGDPDVYQPAEALVSTSWGPTLVIRIAPPVGRQLDWMVSRTVATLLRTKISARPLRLLHIEDLVRFLVFALDTDRTGMVDLATPDTVNVITAWRLLRSADSHPRPNRVPSWTQLIPEMNIAALQEDWAFEFGWRALGAVADTARGLVGRRLGAAGARSYGGPLALPVEVVPRTFDDELPSAAPDGLEGEFDDRIDPRFPVFSAAGFAEALPGPLTPITLDVQLGGLRAGARVLGQVLGVGGTMGEEWESRAVAVFGHRAYVGVSANVMAATLLPGWDQDAVIRRALVNQPQVGDVLPPGEPHPAGGAVGSIAKAFVAARSLAALRHLRSDTQAYRAAAEAEHLDGQQLASLPDAGLAVRARLLRDRIHQGWILTVRWLIDTGVTAAAIEHTRAGYSVSGLDVILDSEAVRTETAGLAAMLRGDPPLGALARDGNVDSIRALSPATAAALDAALDRLRHRGPGEAELSGTVFGDNPAALLMTASEFAADAVPGDPVPATLPRRLAAAARGSRELAYDTTLRFTHELRMTLRELGSRRTAANLLDVAADVFYLTCEELVAMPADARLRIKRRRAERERLQAQCPPDVIDRAWTPVTQTPKYGGAQAESG